MTTNPFGNYSMPSVQTERMLEAVKSKLQARIRKEFKQANLTYAQAGTALFMDASRIRWAVELENEPINSLPMLIDILYRMGILTSIQLEGEDNAAQ